MYEQETELASQNGVQRKRPVNNVYSSVYLTQLHYLDVDDMC